MNKIFQLYFLLVAVMLFGQKNFTTIGEWEQSEKSKKAVVIISQPWCSYCKIMQNYISKNPDFGELSKIYYFIKINASAVEPIEFNGKEYSFLKNGLDNGIHSLALDLGGQNLVFPTTVILNHKGEILHRIPGFLKSSEMLLILRDIR